MLKHAWKKAPESIWKFEKTFNARDWKNLINLDYENHWLQYKIISWNTPGWKGPQKIQLGSFPE